MLIQAVSTSGSDTNSPVSHSYIFSPPSAPFSLLQNSSSTLACCEIFFAFGVPGLAVHFDYLWHIPLQCFSYMHSCSHFSVMACPSKRCQPFVECNFMFFAQWQNTSNIAGHISAIVQSYIIVYSCRRHRVVGFSFCVCVCGCVEALGEGLQVLSWCIIHIYLLISHACTQKEALTGVANDWI